MTSPSNLSLYSIEIELLDLLRYREDVASDPDMSPQEIEASLEAVDNQIREYVSREVKKVDGIAAYLRECETRAEALKAEAKRIAERAKTWGDRHERLKAVTVRVMQQVGVTRLEGAQNTFKLKKNPASVDVAQPNLVPLPYLRRQITMSENLYQRVLDYLRQTAKGYPLSAELFECRSTTPEPMKSEIGKELKAGVAVPGCKLIDDKLRLEIE